MSLNKLLVLLLMISTSVCASSGYGVQIKYLTNKEGEPIDFVCILPAYVKVTGLSFGPDGTGSKMLPHIYMIKPYVFNSGENVVGNLIRNERRMITPFPILVGAGEGLVFDRMIVLKDGYKPVVLRNKDIYSGGQKILLQKTTQADSMIVIPYIKNFKKHQSDLQALLNVQKDIIVEYAADDMLILKSCVENKHTSMGR